MTWWEGVLEVFKVGVQAKNVRDQRKASEQLLAEQKAAEANAKAATDANAQKAFEAQANAAKMAYASLTQPGALVSQPAQISGVSALDGMLPFIILGTVALAAFSMLRK